MTIMLGADGIGNLLFRYLFLMSLKKKNEFLVCTGFEELIDVFEIDNLINFNNKNKFVRVFIDRLFCKPTLEFLSNRKIISSIEVSEENILGKYKREGDTFYTKNGLLKNFVYVKEYYFQSEVFFKKDFANQLRISDSYSDKADSFLKKVPENTQKVFVHIRRGDYANFYIYGKSTLLPMSYFKNQINWFLENRPNCYFVFLSDEPEFIKSEFDYLDNKIISYEKHYGIDLAIMSKCESAVLSPSTFSWWGAYLMKKKDVVFVPKYWLGFNSNIEYPKGTISDFMIEVEVEKN